MNISRDIFFVKSKKWNLFFEKTTLNLIAIIKFLQYLFRLQY